MRPHRIQQPAIFGKHPQISNEVRRQSVSNIDEQERLRRQLKQTQQELTECRRQLDNERSLRQQQNNSLQNTIKLLREELEFRLSEDKEVQKHIQNYQMMNQKLRDQVKKLEEVINSDRKTEPKQYINTMVETPGSHQRGRSPINSDKQNHILTPKSKISRLPQQINIVELDMAFGSMNVSRQNKARVHIL